MPTAPCKYVKWALVIAGMTLKNSVVLLSVVVAEMWLQEIVTRL